MPSYQGEQVIARVPKALKNALKEAAAAQGITESELIRELLQRGLRKKHSAHAVDPLTEALHVVLPRYLRPLHDLVASARYDAIVAREMAQAAALAALMGTGRTADEARIIVQNTMGKAVKTAARRMREHPDWAREAAATTEQEGNDNAAAGTAGR